ncbi:MAG: energy-coupling factor transporter transmembrane component T [Oscillospiraceae bacterium]|nr:energy-coupling factor transporter transmembrane component T [Oscillospiraceae bacterium]
MNDAFNKIHPFTGLLYFAVVIGFSMFFMNPVCITLSLCCALLSAVIINGKRALGLTVKFIIPMILLVMIINPVFNHRGATIITYLPWQNPLTLEAILYGVASAVMFSSVILWFSVFNTVMTSDKIICLFGRIIPSLSLVISMTLRFVPRFVSKFKELKSARITPQKQGFIIKMKILLSELSVMLSWSLESSIESADSMKSRGYGIKGRTAYNIFKFRKTDVIIITAVIISALTMILLIVLGVGKYSFYPVLKIEFSGALSVLFYVIHLGIMLIPSITIAWEGLKWKQLQSKI